jgi:hypothetical protein
MMVLQDIDSQGQTVAAASISNTELADVDKVTVFAPVDGAWPPDDVLPVGAAFMSVRFPEI